MHERVNGENRVVVAFPGQGGEKVEGPRPEQTLLKRMLDRYEQMMASVKGLNNRPAILYGNSFGTYGALVAAGALDERTAMDLVHTRGEIVRETEAKAAEEERQARLRNEDTTFMGRTAMMRLLRWDAATEEISRRFGLHLSNDYGGIKVLSGYVNALNVAVAQIGSRVATVLDVGGAYHDPRRKDDQKKFEPEVAKVKFTEPRKDVLVITSTNPRVIKTPSEVAEELVTMITTQVNMPKALELMEVLKGEFGVDTDPLQSFKKLAGRATKMPIAVFGVDPIPA